MKLHKWIAYQNRFWNGLITHPREPIFDIFDDLATRSERSAISVMGFFQPYLIAGSAFNPPYPGLPLDGDLEDEWRAYHAAWQEFLSRNPRAMIAEMMTDISETHDACSFPVGYEREIEAWVRCGFETERPFDDGWKIDTPVWRQRLADATQVAGDGWVFYQDERLVWRVTKWR